MQVDQSLHDSTVTLASFETSLDLIETIVEHWPQLAFSEGVAMAPLADLFIFAYLLPSSLGSHDNRSVLVARNSWALWLTKGSTDSRAVVLEQIKLKLRSLITDCQAQSK